MKNTTTPPSVIDLFCGAGGLSLGFIRAGFRSQAAFDHWQPAVETYRANLGDHVSVYDRQQAVIDKATVPIDYEWQ